LNRAAFTCRLPASSSHLLRAESIAARLGNNVLLRLLTELLDQRNSLLGKQFASHFDSPKTWAAVLAEHRKIVAALATRDPDRARKAMRAHLQKAHDRWVRQLDRCSINGELGQLPQVAGGG
jgi:DNA-binding FadR family transcriptional regulator